MNYVIKIDPQTNPDADGVALITNFEDRKITTCQEIAKHYKLDEAVVLDEEASLLLVGEFWENELHYQSCRITDGIIPENMEYCEAKLHVRQNGVFYWTVLDRFDNIYHSGDWTLEMANTLIIQVPHFWEG